MPPIVVVATVRLRDGLLDLLADAADGLHQALPQPSDQVDIEQVRTHYVRLRALGDLLDAIGWMPYEVTPPYELDVALHGWAAVTALRRAICRERASAWQYAELDEPEAAGQAGKHRREAEHELDLIYTACERAKVSIVAPKP